MSVFTTSSVGYSDTHVKVRPGHLPQVRTTQLKTAACRAHKTWVPAMLRLPLANASSRAIRLTLFEELPGQRTNSSWHSSFKTVIHRMS